MSSQLRPDVENCFSKSSRKLVWYERSITEWQLRMHYYSTQKSYHLIQWQIFRVLLRVLSECFFYQFKICFSVVKLDLNIFYCVWLSLSMHKCVTALRLSSHGDNRVKLFWNLAHHPFQKRSTKIGLKILLFAYIINTQNKSFQFFSIFCFL